MGWLNDFVGKHKPMINQTKLRKVTTMKTRTVSPKGLNMTASTMLSGILAVVLSVGAASAQPLSVENQIKPSIPFAKVVEIAAATQNGNITALELDHYEDSPIYTAELVDSTSHTVLRIDGNNGEILAAERTIASSPKELHAMLEEQDHQEHGDGDDHDDGGHNDKHFSDH